MCEKTQCFSGVFTCDSTICGVAGWWRGWKSKTAYRAQWHEKQKVCDEASSLHWPSLSSQPSLSGLKNVWVRSLPSSSGILKGSLLMLSYKFWSGAREGKKGHIRKHMSLTDSQKDKCIFEIIHLSLSINPDWIVLLIWRHSNGNRVEAVSKFRMRWSVWLSLSLKFLIQSKNFRELLKIFAPLWGIKKVEHSMYSSGKN